MKLYKVRWSGACYVNAENPEEALKISLKAANHDDAISIGLKATVDKEPIKKIKEVDKEWQDSYPYGRNPFHDNEEMTIKEQLDDK